MGMFATVVLVWTLSSFATPKRNLKLWCEVVVRWRGHLLLEQGLGEAFTGSVREAWTQTYTLLSTVMKDAAKQPPTTHSS
jgi:predicted membrane protein